MYDLLFVYAFILKRYNELILLSWTPSLLVAEIKTQYKIDLL